MSWVFIHYIHCNVLDHYYKHQSFWQSWQEYKDCRVDFDDSRAFWKKQEYKCRLRSTRSTRISCSCGLTWSTHGVSDSEVRISQLKREINFNYNFKWMFQTTVVSDPIWESFIYEWRYNWSTKSMQCTFAFHTDLTSLILDESLAKQKTGNKLQLTVWVHKRKILVASQASSMIWEWDKQILFTNMNLDILWNVKPGLGCSCRRTVCPREWIEQRAGREWQRMSECWQTDMNATATVSFGTASY